MAQPIPLSVPPRNSHTEMESELQSAKTKHAEALLAGYQVLQALHDRGVLDLITGAVGSSDKLLPMAVDAAKSPQGIRATRNLLALGKLVCSIEPELLQALAQSAASLGSSVPTRPLSFWKLAKKLRNEDTRRAITVITCFLEAFGKALQEKPAVEKPTKHATA